MNTKNKIMIMFCILSWVFCSIGILVRPYSKIGWANTFGGQIVCLLAVLLLFVLNYIQLRNQENQLEMQIKHFEKLLNEPTEPLIFDIETGEYKSQNKKENKDD